jgi:hypothetical protein
VVQFLHRFEWSFYMVATNEFLTGVPCSSELRPVFRTVCLLTLRGHFPSHIFESLFWRFVADA